MEEVTQRTVRDDLAKETTANWEATGPRVGPQASGSCLIPATPHFDRRKPAADYFLPNEERVISGEQEMYLCPMSQQCNHPNPARSGCVT